MSVAIDKENILNNEASVLSNLNIQNLNEARLNNTYALPTAAFAQQKIALEKSTSIGALAKALCKFHREPELAYIYKSKLAGGRMGYKYADLAGILKTVNPLLSKHDIACTQLPTSTLEKVYVTTMLLHAESGEYLTSQIEMPIDKSAYMSREGRATLSHAQIVGSVITYARRYAICAVLGICGADDDDDAAKDTTPTLPNPTPTTITSVQVYLIKNLLIQLGDADMETKICNNFGIRGLAELLIVNYNAVVERLKQRIAEKANGAQPVEATPTISNAATLTVVVPEVNSEEVKTETIETVNSEIVNNSNI